MKNFIFAFVIAVLLALAYDANAQVIYPNRGGTGTTTVPTKGYVLVGQTNGTYAPQSTSSLNIIATEAYTGTVTSVGLSVPTGFSISGSPVTTTGTLALTYAGGYEGLLTASSSAWNTFYTTPSNRITAGDHIDWTSNTLNVITSGDWTGTLDSQEGSFYLDRANHSGTQTASTISDFSSTARGLFSSSATGLTYTSGTGAFTLTTGYAIASTSRLALHDEAYSWGNHALAGYITGNQTITLSGDASGSGATSITVAVADDSHAHTGSTLSGIDISSDTNLAGDSEIVLTGDALSIASSIARDSELHNAVTLSGEDYLSLSTQQITANAIDPDNLSASDFGSFTCNGTTCTLDSDSISESMLNVNTATAGYVFQASSTASGGFAWVATSSLGISSTNTSITLDDSTSGSSNYLTFVKNTSGNPPQFVTSNIKVIPSQGQLLATSFYGTVYGQGDSTMGNTRFTSTIRDVNNASGTKGQLLQSTGTSTLWVATSTLGLGTVSSVAMTAPTGLTIAGTPITTTGTLALSLDSGYAIPTTTRLANHDTAFGWGDHALEGYLTTVDISSNTNLSVTATGLELSSDAIALTTGYTIPLTASTTAWNGFYDVPSTRITAGTGIDWSGNTLNGVYTAGDGITLNSEDFDCDTANASTFGCLSTTDWTAFNGKVGSSSIDTSAELAALVGDETGTVGSLVFSGGPTFTGLVTLADFTASNGTTTNATSTNLYATNLSFPDDLFSFSIGSTTPQFATNTVSYLPMRPYPYTVTDIDCFVAGGTSKVVHIFGEFITCDADGASDDGSIQIANVNAGSTTVQYTASTTVGAVNHLFINVYGRKKYK